MREIKFRGKRKGEPHEWLIGDLNHIDGTVYIFPRDSDEIIHSADFYQVIPETVGQYTGMKDKSGKEIYEGDCAMIESQLWIPMEGFSGVVRFIESGFAVDDGLEAYPVWSDAYELTVVGNVHDNPELLIP